MMLCLYVIWHYALTGILTRYLKWAFLSIIAEGIVFIAWGFECPLTIWALDLGDSTGADWLSDVLHLEYVQYTRNFAIFFFIGAILAIRRYYQIGSVRIR